MSIVPPSYESVETCTENDSDDQYVSIKLNPMLAQLEQQWQSEEKNIRDKFAGETQQALNNQTLEIEQVKQRYQDELLIICDKQQLTIQKLQREREAKIQQLSQRSSWRDWLWNQFEST